MLAYVHVCSCVQIYGLCVMGLETEKLTPCRCGLSHVTRLFFNGILSYCKLLFAQLILFFLGSQGSFFFG